MRRDGRLSEAVAPTRATASPADLEIGFEDRRARRTKRDVSNRTLPGPSAAAKRCRHVIDGVVSSTALIRPADAAERQLPDEHADRAAARSASAHRGCTDDVAHVEVARDHLVTAVPEIPTRPSVGGGR
jgi:hypothetical protein